MLAYRIFIWLYPKIAWLIGFSNHKAQKWTNGRKQVFKKLAEAFHKNELPVVWMHCSSVGEFEQGRPVLEYIADNYPNYKILLTFFSPSGYEVRKNYEGAYHVCYLPMDSPSHASRLLNIVQPSLVLFVKYEFWYYYLQEASQRNIPVLLVSGIFREDQPFFRWYGSMHRKMLSFFSHFFVQYEEAQQLLVQLVSDENISVSGDTRFDRVLSIAAEFSPVPVIDHFCDGQQILVAGSTWTDDDEAIDHFVNTQAGLKAIIAPHEIEEERLQECMTLYRNAMYYSVYEKALQDQQDLSMIKVLIIDNVGMLSRLYRYATVCYIGGGFGDDGIHNILEAAVYGRPVVFGPVYDKYKEADELLDAGGAFSGEDALELEKIFGLLLSDKEKYTQAATASKEYVHSKAGATGRIMRYIQENLLLTN